MDAEKLAIDLLLKGMTEEQQKAALDSIKESVSKAKAIQKQRIGENVQVVVQALKKIESDIRSRYDDLGNKIEARVRSIKDGKDGKDGKNGANGRDGRDGSTGPMGPKGKDGLNGRDGKDGSDGVSITDAHIDFDGSLIISLSSGRTINVGEVVAPDIAEKIKVITNGGGTSQSVLDTLASLQAQIDAIDTFGAVSYQGTWNASTNTPTIVAGTGTKGYYYVVSVAGSTSIDGQSLWGVGDWIIFNGSVWQKVDGGNTANLTDLIVNTSTTLDYGTANQVQYLNASKLLVGSSNLTFNGTTLVANDLTDSSLTSGRVTYAGTGGNLVDSANLTFNGTTLTAAAFSGPINGTVGATSANTGNFTTLTTSSTVTHNGGTANGVTYLNGSKVLTSGSALTFDGTNFGVGVTPSAWSGFTGLQVGPSGSVSNSGTGTPVTAFSNNAYYNGTSWVYINTGAAAQYQQSTSQHIWRYTASGSGNITWSEAMRLDTSGNLGIGTSSPSAKLQVNSGSDEFFSFGSTGAGWNYGVIRHVSSGDLGYIGDGVSAVSGGANTDLAIRAQQGGLLFATNGNNIRATIDSSGNLGIGTSSPGEKLTVAGSISTRSGNSVLFYRGDNTRFGSIYSDNDGLNIRQPLNDYIIFEKNDGTNLAILDSSGNLGLGVTPSAWRSTDVALQVRRASLWDDGSNAMYLGQNVYENTSGSYIYIGSDYASVYRQQDGAHAFYTAASGTAGNAITFTQAMTLDASGNLVLGNTSALGKLDVGLSGTSRRLLVTYDDSLVTVKSANNIANPEVLRMIGDTIQFNTGTTGSGSERMRIDISGNVGIGTSSPADILHISKAGDLYLRVANTSTGINAYLGQDSNGTYIGNTGASVVRFIQGSSERARIDSSGNLLVGKTATTFSAAGSYISYTGKGVFTVDADEVLLVNRLTNDGNLIRFYQAGIEEGNISVSGTTVSYNGGHLARWAQLPDGSKDDTILKGTVMTNLDAMCEWVKDGQPLPNEQLNRMKVSDVEGDTNVAGVFVNWTRDEQCNTDDINIAMTGDMIIRIAHGVVVQRGDLLMSAGDGTAKPQGDDIRRSKTIAKVTSNHVTCTYVDGSYCVPCVLMAC